MSYPDVVPRIEHKVSLPSVTIEAAVGEARDNNMKDYSLVVD